MSQQVTLCQHAKMDTGGGQGQRRVASAELQCQLTCVSRGNGLRECVTNCRRARSHDEPCKWKTPTTPVVAFMFHT